MAKVLLHLGLNVALTQELKKDDSCAQPPGKNGDIVELGKLSGSRCLSRVLLPSLLVSFFSVSCLGPS